MHSFTCMVQCGPQYRRAALHTSAAHLQAQCNGPTAMLTSPFSGCTNRPGALPTTALRPPGTAPRQA